MRVEDIMCPVNELNIAAKLSSGKLAASLNILVYILAGEKYLLKIYLALKWCNLSRGL